MKYFKRHKPILYLFFFALLVRVVYNITVARNYYPQSDSLYYQLLGQHLISHHCFCLDPMQHPYIPTVARAPLWPALLAGLSLLFGPGDFAARLLLSTLDAATCVVIYLFAKKLFTVKMARFAGIVAALYPGLYIYTGWLYTETLYTFLLIALCYTLFRLQAEPLKNSIAKVIIAAILLSLLALTRPNGLLLVAPTLCWLLVIGWQKLYSWRFIAGSVLTILLLICALLAPWTVRNYTVSGSFIPVATGDGTVLLGAYNDAILTEPLDQMTWINPLRSNPRLAQSFHPGYCAAACEVKRENAYKIEAEQWAFAHRTSLSTILAAHLLNVWLPTSHETDLAPYRFSRELSAQFVLLMMRSVPLPVFLLASFGLFVTRHLWRELLFSYLIILLTLGQCLLFYGSPRFRAPIEPLLILLASGTFYWLQNRLHRSSCDTI